ncbi:MAG: aminotransferase class IV [Planctomycetaceae bacterium]|nr:aminotransferase class IV [Planctomycetaceae bacterium]
MSDAIAYLNGQYVRLSEATLPVWDYGVVQAATVTDMVRTFAGEPFRLEQHLRRFAASRAALGITLTESGLRLEKVIREVLSRNRGLIPSGGDCGIVFFATPGAYLGYTGFAGQVMEDVPAEQSGHFPGTRPTLCVHPFTLAFSRFHQGYEDGIALAIPKIHQIAATSLPPGIKYRSRLHWYLAEREVREVDRAAAALLLDDHGCVTETNSGNLFIVRDGLILTPRADTTLAGVSQEFVMELARAAGLSVSRADLTRDYVLAADEVFLSSTTYCLMPVTRLDLLPIGDGRPGPVFRQLLANWSEAVGIDLRAQARQMSQM